MFLSSIKPQIYTNRYSNYHQNRISFGQDNPLNYDDNEKIKTKPKHVFIDIYTKSLETAQKCKEYLGDKINKIGKMLDIKKNKPANDIDSKKQQSLSSTTTQIPAYKQSFDIVLLKNIIKENPEITADWVKKYPKSVLTILHATATALVDKDSVYKDIDEFNQMFPSAEDRAKTIQTILKTSNIVEKAESKLEEEKAAYIKSIWQDYLYVETPFVPMNKEKNLLGLKALQKYGTNQDLKNLPEEYRILEDNDLMLEYAKLVNKVGKDFNDFHTLETTVNRREDIFSIDTMEEVMKGVKKHTVDDSPKGHWTNTDFGTYKDYEYFANKAKEQGKTEMEENAKAVMQRIVEDNPWMTNKINRLNNAKNS